MKADRIAAGVFLFRVHSGTALWLLLRNRKRGDWGFPKGHQEKGEGLYATALRECAEECGIAHFARMGAALHLRYRIPNGALKEVHYFPAITNEITVQLSKEHNAFKWLPSNEVLAHLNHPNLANIFSHHAEQVHLHLC